jgi:hypothetical protein
MPWFANILLNLCVCVRGPPTTSTTHNNHSQLSKMGCWMGLVASCCVGVLNKSQISNVPYFSIKINMGTVQQYGVGEGEVFSILDL